MTDHRENITSVIDLVGDLCNGTFGPDELVQLEQLLLTDHTALQSYIEYMDLHAELAAQAPGDGKGVRYILPERPEGCFAQNVPDPFSIFRWTHDYFSQPGPLSILAAAIFMVCLISILSILPAPTYERSRFNHAYNTSPNSPGRQPRDKDGKLNFVARITGLHNCRWADNYLPPLRYAHLGIGRELKLDSGMVKITYKTGATVVLEGPVEFTVEQKNACRLDVGKLAAKVPKPAVGFTVETPTTTIVDLGTEFGVEVEKDRFTDVHVFQGIVEAELLAQAGSPPVKLRLAAGQAARVDQSTGKIHRRAAEAGQFARQTLWRRNRTALPVTSCGYFVVPSGDVIPALVGHWKFDGNYNDSIGGHDGIVVKGGEDSRVSVSATGGKIGGAAGFTESYVDDSGGGAVRIPGKVIPGTSFSIALWSFSPSESTNKGYLVTAGSGLGSLCLRRYHSDQYAGSISHKDPPGSTFGSVGPYARGVWRHHVVTHDNDRIGRWYVDGVLASTQSAASKFDKLQDDLYVGNWKSLDGIFDGRIDDLQIYNAALTCLGVAELFGNPGKTLGERR